MKPIAYLILAMFVSLHSLAQETENSNAIELQNMKTPNAPGFQLLDISPSLIEKPSNPKEFTATLMSLSNNGSILPKNFAMEIAPFWLFDQHAPITKYLNIKDSQGNSNAFSGIYRKMSISLASVYNDSTSGTLLEKTNYLAFGVRTNIVTLRSKSQSDAITTALKAYNKRINELREPPAELLVKQANLLPKISVLQEYKNTTPIEAIHSKIADYKIKLTTAATENEKNQIQKELDAAIKIKTDYDAVVQQLNDLTAELSITEAQIKAAYTLSTQELEKRTEKDEKLLEYYTIIEQPPVFQLDAAFAYSDAYQDNKSENKRFNRSGFWLTGTVNLSGLDEENLNDKISLLFTGRYLNDNVLKDSIAMTFEKEKGYDIGMKLEYKIKKFSLGIEHLKRNYSGRSDIRFQRTVGILQYKINDELYFTGSYGKNFGEVNTLFTLFGINYGFGKSSVTNTSE
ncbi:hypothetical protein [Flavobacterium sp. GCM10023249]|uniref:hypothetical protein n=1 Tax=unclassified Flavobacterium TaxID=196869 RepID=UPI003608A044